MVIRQRLNVVAVCKLLHHGSYQTYLSPKDKSIQNLILCLKRNLTPPYSQYYRKLTQLNGGHDFNKQLNGLVCGAYEDASSHESRADGKVFFFFL